VIERLTSLLQPSWIGWWDLLDIAIVSLLIYELLKLLRRTHAVQILIGGGLIMVLYYAAQFTPLQTLNWLIGDMFGYAVFAVIVLFQGDIRRALARLGRAPFFRYVSRPAATDQTIEDVVVALRMLAEQKTGAIVAIEREIGLRNYVESGIPVDAKVSYDLLVTFFSPGSPLHDGAVLIQQDRIAAAACFLPLSVDTPVARNLGTRHRAAVGLSEETDAIVLVVSEETGLVSLVVDAQMEPDLDPARLRYRIEALMQRSPFGRKRRGSGGVES
jgi:diadenylate cyclase